MRERVRERQTDRQKERGRERKREGQRQREKEREKGRMREVLSPSSSKHDTNQIKIYKKNKLSKSFYFLFYLWTEHIRTSYHQSLGGEICRRKDRLMI